VAYTYDDPVITQSNHLGQLSKVSNGVVTTTYNDYDAVGQLLSGSKTISGDTTRTTKFRYDLSGKLRSTVYPDNYQVNNYYYAGTGLLQSVVGITDYTNYVTYEDYPATGKIHKAIYGNNTETIYSRDAFSTRLTAILTKDAAGAAIIDKSYSYSKAGDIENIDDAVKGINYSYDYDKLHRLLGEINSGSSDTLRYGYNDMGGFTTKINGDITMSYSYDTAHVHAVKKITIGSTTHGYTYDSNGNMTAGPDLTDPANPATRTIAYNSDNMPAKVRHSVYGVTTFTYDGGGSRAKKSGPSGTTYYHSVLFEKQNSNLVKYIFAAGQRVAMVKSGQVQYFHKDHLGSSSVITDASGVKIQEAEYLPFGGQRGSSVVTTSNYGFTEQEKDPETGLYNYDARLYDPVVGLFVTADITVPDSGSSQGYNRYAYCANNPLIYVDASGHGAISDLWEDLKDSFCPIRIYKNGGIRGLVMYYQDPIFSSFSYTHQGGFGTSGGYTYGGLAFGGRYQERGPNAGLDGYIGYGYTHKDFKIGIFLWHNTEFDYTVDIRVSYKNLYLKYGYFDINGYRGLSGGVGYSDNGYNVYLSRNSAGEWGLSANYEYNDDIAIDGFYNITSGEYSVNAKYSYFEPHYSSNEGYSVFGMGNEESLILSAAAIVGGHFFKDELSSAEDWLKEKEGQMKGWLLNHGIDAVSIENRYKKIKHIYKRFGYNRDITVEKLLE
jgi:RHS repeat-associated protein